MPKDDYFRIVFEILKDLYVAKKKAEPVSLIEISADNLKIPQGYRDTILSEMLEAGYVKGFRVKEYINGTQIMDLEGIDITPMGIEYLKENGMMKKVMEYLKTIGEFIPMI
jgi:yjcQ protein